MSDLISRQAAIDSMLKVGDWYVEQGNDEAGRGVAQCQRVIYELPSAERPKGKWIAIHDDVFADTYRCSECGKQPIIEWDYVLSNFCPNCGADMREVKNDNANL